MSVVDYGKYFDPLLKLKVPGVHNQLNASAALAVAERVGIKKEVAENALTQFAGTWRRFEYKGEVNGAKVYDDYGHHPTEITATIRGARELYPERKLTLVFQSHTYTRTNELFEHFVDALGLADMTYILPIYAAREENVSGISHTMLADSVVEKGRPAIALDTFDETVARITATANENDLILVMGAGDVTQVAGMLTNR